MKWYNILKIVGKLIVAIAAGFGGGYMNGAL